MPPELVLKTAVGHLTVEHKIGAGAFGSIYRAQNPQTQKYYAVKTEKIDTSHPQLLREAGILKRLQTSLGVPELIHYGKTDEHHLMVMTLLGDSLEDLYQNNKNHFNAKTVLMVGDQCLQRLEFVHSRGIIHRDIKPDNFMTGVGQYSSVINLIDFGLSGSYWDTRGRHIPYKEYGNNRNVKGTVRYVSLNVHHGIEQSRRDDLESLGYVLVYFLRSSMPWSGIQAKTKAFHFKKIMEVKMSTSLESLCKNMPSQLMKYLQVVRRLEFEEDPDYKRLRTLFANAYHQLGYRNDGLFGWSSGASRKSVDVFESQRQDVSHTFHNQPIPLGFESTSTTNDSCPSGSGSGLTDDIQVSLEARVPTPASRRKVRKNPMGCFCGNLGFS